MSALPICRRDAAVTNVLQSLSSLKSWYREQQQPPSAASSSAWLLAALERRGPSRVTALADAARLDASVVSRHVSALEAGGFVDRTTDPDDRRAHLVRITAAGREWLVETQDRLASGLSARLALWDDQELDVFSRSLKRFAADLAVLGEATGHQEPHSSTDQKETAPA